MRHEKDHESIYFVTSSDIPFSPGHGGTEAFTFGQIQELLRLGFDARLVTVGLKGKDGRHLVPDVPFLDVASEEDLSDLDAHLIGVSKPFVVPTKKPAYVMVHVPPMSSGYPLALYKQAVRKHQLIANSQFAKREWAKELHLDPAKVQLVYPFADPIFGSVKRGHKPAGLTRVLFAGRLDITKGIYLLLEALHHPVLQEGYRFTVTAAGGHTPDGRIIEAILRAHPRITVTPKRTTPQAMADLMADNDILVAPSNHQFWQEAFGMVSVEAQHAGCRVVASRAGGLPETDIGGLHLFEPGNSHALAAAIEQARLAGPVDAAMRAHAAKQFALAQSVESLLAIIGKPS